jgi:hypothetical protein
VKERDLSHLEKLACDVFFDTLKADRIDLSLVGEKDLADKLLHFRVGAAIKLRKLDPLILMAVDIASRYGLSVSVKAIPNILADLAGRGGAGKFRIAVLTDKFCNQSILLNAVAVHDKHGDDKSKEWGARRLASLYRFEKGKITTSAYDKGLFILDGEWDDKDAARLHRCGWTHICRLGELESVLKKTFGVKKPKDEKVKVAVMSLSDDEVDV